MKTIKVLASFVALLVAFGVTARPPLNQQGVAHHNPNLAPSLRAGWVQGVSNVDTLVATFRTISGFQFPFFNKFTSLPTIAITGVTTPYCPGITRSFTVNSNGARPTNYTWSVSPVGSTYTVTGGTINVTFGTATSTAISVTATYPSGPITSSITLTNGKPIVTMATSPVSPCSGTPITVTASSNLPSTYSWSTGVIFAGANATSTINVTSGFNTYKVTVNPGNGCTAVGSINTSVAPAPTVTISPANITTCSGTSVTLIASGTAGNTYSWSTNATTSSITVSPTATTVYTVTATRSNGCTGSASRVVTVDPAPTATISGNNPICEGGTATLTASGGGTYLWNNGATTAIITESPSVSTMYIVTVTNSSGCTASASRTVIPSTVIPNIQLTITGSCFGTDPVTITANYPVPTPTYVWGWSTGGATTQTITAIGPDTYRVTATGEGCTAIQSVTLSPCRPGQSSGATAYYPEKNSASSFTSFTVNPNPTSGSFNLSIKVEEPQEIGIVIRDLTGRVLQEHQLGKVNDSNYLFDLTAFPAGMYLLSVNGEQGQLSVMKLIKE